MHILGFPFMKLFSLPAKVMIPMIFTIMSTMICMGIALFTQTKETQRKIASSFLAGIYFVMLALQ
jgi:hypothetical protein